MLDVPCFIEAQKVMWVKRLLKLDSGSWKAYPKHLFNKMLDEHSFQCNTTLKQWERTISPFYMQLLEIWEKTKENPQNDPIKIRREILWRNKKIKINERKSSIKNGTERK